LRRRVEKLRHSADSDSPIKAQYIPEVKQDLMPKQDLIPDVLPDDMTDERMQQVLC